MTKPDEQGRQSPRPGVAVRVVVAVAVVVGVALAVGLVINGPWRSRAGGPDVARRQAQKLHDAAQEYLSLFGRCPTLDDLVREDLIMRNQGWDQFGTEHRIRCTPGTVEARSAGKDTRFDTPDDVVFVGPRAVRGDGAGTSGSQVPP